MQSLTFMNYKYHWSLAQIQLNIFNHTTVVYDIIHTDYCLRTGNHLLGPMCLLHSQVLPFADQLDSYRLQMASLCMIQALEQDNGENSLMLQFGMWFRHT